MATFSCTLFTNPFRAGRIWYNAFLKAEFYWFEFGLFLLLDWLPHQGQRAQTLLPFFHSWKKNTWIHTFPNGFSIMWNANSFVQDLNSDRWVNFQGW